MVSKAAAASRGVSDEEMIAAIRTGVRLDGRILAPVMPWQSYAALSDADARALVACLRSLAPVAHAVPEPVGTTAGARAVLRNDDSRILWISVAGRSRFPGRARGW